MGERVLIVFDGDAWFVRRVRVIEHDLERDEKVYRCDEHLGGPFPTADDAVAAFSVGWKGIAVTLADALRSCGLGMCVAHSSPTSKKKLLKALEVYDDAVSPTNTTTEGGEDARGS